MYYCIEFQRKAGTFNANQAQRGRRIELAATDEHDARKKATAEAKRSGFDRFFNICTVRKI